jgi:hypothetical protein
MKKIIFLLLIFLTSIHASGGCTLEQSGDLNVSWKAYKTLEKLGVSGKFTAVKYTPNKKSAKNFRGLFVGSTVSIDMSKIETGDTSRDKTLVDSFFSKLVGESIEGVIVDIEADKRIGKGARTGIIDVNLTMNKKGMTIPMAYHYNKGDFRATGVIDLFDFSANTALSMLNKSCFSLHQGKTWNDVHIEFKTTIKATLCNVKTKK